MTLNAKALAEKIFIECMVIPEVITPEVVKAKIESLLSDALAEAVHQDHLQSHTAIEINSHRRAVKEARAAAFREAAEILRKRVGFVMQPEPEPADGTKTSQEE